MADITEYGEIAGAVLDEWGFRRVNTLIEDGRRVLVVAAPPPPPPVVYRVIGDGLASAVYGG